MSIYRLQYTALDGSHTQIDFFKDYFPLTDEYVNRVEADQGVVEAESCVTRFIYGQGDDIVDMCGSEEPLLINWGNGDHNATTLPSSATLNLVIRNLDERAALEDVFNGGWVIIVYKDTNVFWRGKITDTLNIEQYKEYPYRLSLNCNDGVGETKNNQFLTIDFPEPWPNKVNVLQLITKLINKFLYPNDEYKLFVSFNLYPDGTIDDGRRLEYVYLDPLVFMDYDQDQYIRNSDLIDSLLGILDLRMFQWGGNWYLMSKDAPWNAGNIQLTEYDVVDETPVYISRTTLNQGILDLYKCIYGEDVQIRGTANINFIAPLRQVVLSQQFQMNSNILPAFANRGANFYRGFDGVDLEYNPAPIANRMRHWTNVNNFNGIPYTLQDNAGYLQVPVFSPGGELNSSAYVEWTIDPEIQFDRFFFAINSVQTFRNNILNQRQDKVGIKRVVEIRYTSVGGTHYYFWRNNPNTINDPEAFDGWTTDARQYRWDFSDPISLESLMPEDALWTGGTFRFTFYNGYDENFFLPDYYLLYSGLQLGIITAGYKILPEEQKTNWLKKGMLPILGELLLSPMPIGIWTMYYGTKHIQQKKRDKRLKSQIGNDAQLNFQTTDIDWDNDLVVDINPNSRSQLNMAYRIGITYAGLKSYHDIHLSSFYDISGVSLESWLDQSEVFKQGGETTVLDLITWRGRQFIRDNSTYTTQLSGEWRSSNITPFQLVNDFEGRIYQAFKLQWRDYRATWDNIYTEFKALQNVDGLPLVCDFNQYAFDDSFCKGSGGQPVPGIQYNWLIGTDGVDFGFWLNVEPPQGFISPTDFEGEGITKLANVGGSTIELSLGLISPTLLPGVSKIELYLLELDEVIDMTPTPSNTYSGSYTGIRTYLEGKENDTLKITLKAIE